MSASTADEFTASCLEIWEQVRTATDNAGRERAELFMKLPSKRDLPDYYASIKEPIDLKTVKDKLNKQQYESVDEFEHDMRLIFSNCKSYNMAKSEIYEDATFLEKLFNRLLKEHKEQAAAEAAAASAEAAKPVPVKLEERLESRNYLETLKVGRRVYEIGDFVYIANPADESKPTIVHIHDLWTEKGTKQKGFIGTPFVRPEQTYHVPTRRFYVNEVFRTRAAYDYSFEDVTGSCCVLYIRDYVKGHPEGFEEKDVYVCESRYNDTDKSKDIEAIKNWKSMLPKAQQAKAVYHPPLIGEPRKNVNKTVPSVFFGLNVAPEEKQATPKEKQSSKSHHSPEAMGSIKIKAPPSAEPSPHFTVSNKRSREAETATPPPASSAKKAKLSSEASILDEVDFPGAKSDHGFSRWTIAETLVLAQSISKIGVNDWPKVSEDCHEHLYRSNHHHPHKLRERFRLLTKNMPPGGSLEQAMLAAVDEKVDEGYLTSWLIDYWVRPGVIPDQPAAVALLELADSSSVSSSISKCNFASCSRLSFSSAEDLFAHIRSKHVLEFEKEFGSRQRLAAFGTLVPLSTQVPPTYVDESALSEDFVKQYVHTPDNKLVWFSRPPVDVLPPQPRLVHSAEFLKFKETETPETEEQPQPMVVDEVAAVENEKYQERLKEVEAANWLSLLKTFVRAGESQQQQVFIA